MQFVYAISHIFFLEVQSFQRQPQPSGRTPTISHTPACQSFPSTKTSVSLTPVLRGTRAGRELRAQLRVVFLQLFVLTLQIREVLLEVFDLLVLALPERSLRLAVLCTAPLFSLLEVELAFCLRGWGGFLGYVQLSARSSCRPGL